MHIDPAINLKDQIINYKSKNTYFFGLYKPPYLNLCDKVINLINNKQCTFTKIARLIFDHELIKNKHTIAGILENFLSKIRILTLSKVPIESKETNEFEDEFKNRYRALLNIQFRDHGMYILGNTKSSAHNYIDNFQNNPMTAKECKHFSLMALKFLQPFERNDLIDLMLSLYSSKDLIIDSYNYNDLTSACYLFTEDQSTRFLTIPNRTTFSYPDHLHNFKNLQCLDHPGKNDDYKNTDFKTKSLLLFRQIDKLKNFFIKDEKTNSFKANDVFEEVINPKYNYNQEHNLHFFLSPNRKRFYLLNEVRQISTITDTIHHLNDFTDTLEKLSGQISNKKNQFPHLIQAYLLIIRSMFKNIDYALTSTKLNAYIDETISYLPIYPSPYSDIDHANPIIHITALQTCINLYKPASIEQRKNILNYILGSLHPSYVTCVQSDFAAPIETKSETNAKEIHAQASETLTQITTQLSYQDQLQFIKKIIHAYDLKDQIIISNMFEAILTQKYINQSINGYITHETVPQINTLIMQYNHVMLNTLTLN